jgi:hypothetical protein
MADILKFLKVIESYVLALLMSFYTKIRFNQAFSAKKPCS